MTIEEFYFSRKLPPCNQGMYVLDRLERLYDSRREERFSMDELSSLYSNQIEK